ncbi:MAG: hypothetical protein ACYSSO_10350 [Planctomycetota bacterium]|jgi:hypothetical protein
MNYEIQNLTRRLVSVHCNSGRTCHLPPGYKHEVPEQEVTGNTSVKKLQDRKLIAVRQLSKSSVTKPDSEDTGKADTSSEKEGGSEKPSKKKSQATK